MHHDQLLAGRGLPLALACEGHTWQQGRASPAYWSRLRLRRRHILPLPRHLLLLEELLPLSWRSLRRPWQRLSKKGVRGAAWDWGRRSLGGRLSQNLLLQWPGWRVPRWAWREAAARRGWARVRLLPVSTPCSRWPAECSWRPLGKQDG